MSHLKWPLGEKISALLAELDVSSEEVVRRVKRELDEIIHPQLKGMWTIQQANALKEEFYARLRLTFVPDLLEGTITSGLPRARCYALGALTLMWADRARPYIFTALKDEDASVRMAATSWCSYLQLDSTVPALIDLLGDSSDDVVQAAVRALGSLRATDALPHLRRLATSENWQHRQAAIYELGYMKDAASLPIVRAALRDKHRSVRKSAQYALSSFDWERRRNRGFAPYGGAAPTIGRVTLD